MALTDILVHRAVPVSTVGFGPWIEGERDEEEVLGVPFACTFFPPGSRERGRRGRTIDQPLVLTGAVDIDGNDVLLHSEDRVDITGPGLAEEWLGRWQVDGAPEQFGKPGKRPLGSQVRLKRVTD